MGKNRVFLLLVYQAISSAILSAAQSQSSRNKQNLGAAGCTLTKDVFVRASPLSLAAVCSDGIILVAFHTAAAMEPLLIDAEEQTNCINESDSTNTVTENLSEDDLSKHLSCFRGLPTTGSAPHRIQQLDDNGTCLLCSGWRADGEALANKCRSLLRRDFTKYGETNALALAADTSTWLANCAFSDSLRALSSVGLLASCINGNKQLFLIDASGYHEVRAFAVGSGSRLINNEILSQMELDKLGTEEALEHLLIAIQKKVKSELIPRDAYVEIATLTPLERTMSRIHLKQFRGMKSRR